jgi:hypothetical protein
MLVSKKDFVEREEILSDLMLAEVFCVKPRL